jgi:hypothetical protein
MPNRLRLLDVLLSSLPQKLGFCQNNIAEVGAAVNEIQQRLLIAEEQPDEGWWGTFAQLAFNLDSSNPYITFPRQVARATALDVCKRPVIIRNQWYEFLQFGHGLKPSSCSGNRLCENLMAYDRGEWSSTVVTNKDLSPPNKKLRFYATDPLDMDTNKRVFTQGLDANGATIYSQDGLTRVDGIFTTLISPFADTDREITKISGIQKDITNGPVQIYEVDTVTGAETLLLTMEPSEQVACYRRLFLNGLPNCCGSGTTQVVVMVKLEFIPVRVPTDFLLICSLPALIQEAQAMRYESIDIPASKQMAGAHHAMALRYLFGQLDAYMGKERVSITVPLFGSNPLPRAII